MLKLLLGILFIVLTSFSLYAGPSPFVVGSQSCLIRIVSQNEIKFLCFYVESENKYILGPELFSEDLLEYYISKISKEDESKFESYSSEKFDKNINKETPLHFYVMGSYRPITNNLKNVIEAGMEEGPKAIPLIAPCAKLGEFLGNCTKTVLVASGKGTEQSLSSLPKAMKIAGGALGFAVGGTYLIGKKAIEKISKDTKNKQPAKKEGKKDKEKAGMFKKIYCIERYNDKKHLFNLVRIYYNDYEQENLYNIYDTKNEQESINIIKKRVQK